MSKLIILRGNSGSGKTTKNTPKNFGASTMRLSHDMIRMEDTARMGKRKNCKI